MKSGIQLQGVEIHPESREVVVRGEVKRLPWRVFDVLFALAERAGSVVPKEELLQSAWSGAIVDESNLTQAIAQIRKALGEVKPGKSYIETVPRIGYRISAEAVLPPPGTTAEAPVAQPANESKPKSGHLRRWIALAAAALLLLLGAVFGSRDPAEESEIVEIPFTAFEGDEQSPSFSPDGREVVFTWAKPGGTPDIYIKSVESENVRPLVESDATEKGPVFSPDGKFVAFVRVGTEGTVSVVIKPREGGPERVVTRCDNLHPTVIGSPGPYVAWTRDGKSLIYTSGKSLHLWRLHESRSIRLTEAPSGSARGDVDPALSPDGRNLVFVRDNNTGSSALHRLQLNHEFEPAGPPTVLLSNGNWNRSPAWHPNGRTLVFNSGHWGRQRLWFMTVDKPSTAKPIPGAGLDAQQPTISAKGEILFARWFFRRQIWTVPLAASGAAPGGLRPLFTSTRADTLPSISRDGLYLAFQSDRTGTFEVWMSRMDGSDLRRITSFGGPPAGSPDISPDNKLIAFDAIVDGQRDIFICDVHGSGLRRVTSHPADDVIPRWSADGTSLYFSSFRDGANALYRIQVASGATEKITSGPGLLAQESPDGKTLYFTERDGFAADVFATPVGGGPISRVISGIRHRGVAVSDAGIYYVPAGMPNEIRLKDTRTATDSLVIRTSDRSLHHLASDAAGRVLTVVVEGPPPGDLMLIRGLPVH
jgi:Tol biopolymer transport system component/DNA-binding winged helix-turn-helix (wHTH) protein